MHNMPLILASTSPRRLELLKTIGIVPSRVLSPNIDESARASELPRLYVKRMAFEKLQAVLPELGEKAFVLAADTIVVCGRKILHKAETAQDVRDCLARLSGRRHTVYTALAVRTAEGKIIQRVAETKVSFKLLSKVEIESYVSAGDGIGKAGGYAIQGLAGAFVRFISGTYSNILGLPVFDLAQILQGNGYKI